MTTATHGIRKAAVLYAAGRTSDALAELEMDVRRWDESCPAAWSMILDIHRAERRRAELEIGTGGTEPGQVHFSEGLDGAMLVTLRGDLRNGGIGEVIAAQVVGRRTVSLDFADVGRMTPEVASSLTRLMRQLRLRERRVVIANLDEISAQLFLEVQGDVPGTRKSIKRGFAAAERAAA